MPKFLFKVSLTTEGVTGLRKEGGTARRQVVHDSIQKMGGKLESFYFAFGAYDVFVIAEMPDNEAAAAFATEVSSTGRMSLDTVVLITPEEMDRASTQESGFRPPGG